MVLTPMFILNEKLQNWEKKTNSVMASLAGHRDLMLMNQKENLRTLNCNTFPMNVDTPDHVSLDPEWQRSQI